MKITKIQTKKYYLIIAAVILAIAGVFLFSQNNIFAQSYNPTSSDDEVQDLNNRIQQQRRQLDAIQQKQKEYLESIKQKQKEKSSLSSELSILDDRLEKAKLDISGVEVEIDKTNLEINKTNIDIENKNIEIGKEQEHIANLLKLIYKQGQTDTLEILLLNKSLADFVNQVKYLENTNSEVAKSLENLKTARKELEDNQRLLSDKQKKLSDLKSDLDSSKFALEQEQNNKNYILEETKQSERRYQALLLQAKKEQDQAAADIFNMEKKVREKLAASAKKKLDASYDGLAWPVPKNYITSIFHDPDYPFRRLIGEHPAVDIKAAQGTTLVAAASGYVARVKSDGSRNYAYIMIIHGDGLSTVYGHVSRVSVKTDDYVTQGQVIGRTGGTPGTPGAGPFCTGPHLHFEVRKKRYSG